MQFAFKEISFPRKLVASAEAVGDSEGGRTEVGCPGAVEWSDLMIPDALTGGWREALGATELRQTLQQLGSFLLEERRSFQVFPQPENVFRALELTPLERVKVVILGQDPYHDVGQAHGLSFSVPRGVSIPPSLRNIYRELAEDQRIVTPGHGCLESWAERGVLLLNTVLTVRAHSANSHRGRGWERVTASMIERVNELPRVAFLLWGASASRIASELHSRHLVIQSAHPSPLSAYRGFWGSRPFSRVNAWLRDHGESEIDWRPECLK
jgi:uracil-DNA glycosylase